MKEKFLQFNWLIFAIGIVVAFSFFFGSYVKADYIINQDQGDNGWCEGACAQSFKGTDSWMTALEIKGGYFQDDKDITIYLCDSVTGSFTPSDYFDSPNAGCFASSTEIQSWYLPNGFLVASTSPDWFNLNLTDPYFIATGSTYFFTYRSTDTAYPYPIKSSNRVSDGNYYSGGNSSVPGGYDFLFRVSGTTIDYSTSTVTIIDVDDWDNQNVQVGNWVFTPTRYTNCMLDDPCEIYFDYSYSHIGWFAVLMDNTEEELENYTDYIGGLKDKPLLRDSLTPYQRTSADGPGNDGYYIVIWSPTEESGLELYDVDVTWLASSTDEMDMWDSVYSLFKNAFPFPIIRQIRKIIDDNATTTVATSTFALTMADIAPTEFSGLDYSQSEGELLSINMIKNNLPTDWWEDKPYHLMEILISVIWLFLYYRLLQAVVLDREDV